ncbi:MAG: DNA polymerase, partial [Candidatus Woesearchaeota archaeon]
MKKERYTFEFEAIEDDWQNVLIFDIETAESLEDLQQAIATESKELLNPLQARHFAFAIKKANLMKANRNTHKLLAKFERSAYKDYYIYLQMNSNAEQMARDLLALADAMNLDLVAHAGLHFDFLIFKTLIKKQELKVVEQKGNYFLRKGRRYYRLIDTLQLTKAGLQASLEAFGIDLQKDYSNDLKSYLQNDIKMTIELVEALKKSGIAFTLTRTARRFYFDIAEKQGLTGIDTYLPENMAIEYSGGRVQVFKAFAENVNVYDANSLYPFAMARFVYPILQRREDLTDRLAMNVARFSKDAFAKMIEALRPAVLNAMLEDARKLKELFELLGVYFYCRVRLQGINEMFADLQDVILRYFPFSIIKNGRRAYILEPEATYIVQGYEVLFLAFFDFEVIDAYMTGAEKLFFAEEIEDLYQKRKIAKANGDAMESQRIKAVLVNLYGVFGLRQEKSYEEAFSSEDRELVALKISNFTEGEIMHFETVSALKLAGRDAKATLLLTDDKYILSVQEKKFAKRMSAPLLATAITSAGRFWLLANIYYIAITLNADVYYCDTDSIFTNAELESSAELGSFKFEYRAKSAYFIAPKTYIAVKEDAETVIKAKGTGKRLVADLVVQSMKTDH